MGGAFVAFFIIEDTEMPKKYRVGHCSLQYSEVGGAFVACFVIEDTGMSIMIWGPRINIIITKIEIGRK